jgi:hypothetical protein
MQKFDQTILHEPEKGAYGDCTRAVVYTLAQKDLDLPHPIDSETMEWNFDFFVQLGEVHNLHLDYFASEDESWPRYVGRTGLSPRNIRHLVVWDRETNSLFHDPHPSRLGLIPGTEDGWFVLR